jgi:hypothetical protein
VRLAKHIFKNDAASMLESEMEKNSLFNRRKELDGKVWGNRLGTRAFTT